MREKLLLILFFIACSTLFSLDFVVEGFREDPYDHVNDVGKKILDNNADACAVLRVETDVPEEIYITSPQVYKKEKKIGVFYFYINHRKRLIKFSAKGYIPKEYKTPQALKKGMTYVIKIKKRDNKSVNKSIDIKKPKPQRVSQAYGYILGQELSLEAIRTLYPQLEKEISFVESTFNLSFGNTKKKMKKYLIDCVGKEEFNKLVNELILGFDQILSQSYTKEIALDFIHEVNNRAKGSIPSPILETLLSFQFLDNPQDEFRLGFTNVYRTKGHPKAKNTDWQIKVPKSWKAEEGDRPNIVQKFTSDYGKGLQMIVLMVRNLGLPQNYEISKKELNDFFSEEEIKDMIPTDSKYISFSNMYFDGNLGCILEFETKRESVLNVNVRMRCLFCLFIVGNKLCSIYCVVSGGDAESKMINPDLSAEMKKYKPLFLRIVNSLVINDKYN